MRKNLLFSFLIVCLLGTTAFASFTDLKKESEKAPLTSPKENRLSEKELNSMSKRAEIDNLSVTHLTNKELPSSRNNLKATKQVYVEHRHGGYYWYGGAGLILVIVLVVILV